MSELFTSFLQAPWMLLGLAVLVVPPLIHLLSRRRFDVVEWGAMQFLDVANASRRRWHLDDVLLMLLRMAILAALVFVAAGPFLRAALLGRFAPSAPRDVVLLIDGSGSMSAALGGTGTSPAERVVPWVRDFLSQAGPETGVSVLLVRDRPVEMVAPFERDPAIVLDRLTRIPPPGGTAAWPEAVRQAREILERSAKGSAEIVLVGDQLRHGFTDAPTQVRWDLLAGEMRSARPSAMKPRLWAVSLADERPAPLPNVTLSSLTARRPVVAVGQEVAIRGELMFHRVAPFAPHRLRTEIDGQPGDDLPAPAVSESAKAGTLSFAFSRKFARPGSHLLTVIVEADPPGVRVRDAVRADDRRSIVVEVVPTICVLLVTGDATPESPYSPISYLRNALAPRGDVQPAFSTQTVSVGAFTPAMLRATPTPRVVVLHDVTRLGVAQLEAVTSFIDAGGGVLVAPGERADLRWYAEASHRGGNGPLPALMGEPLGDESDPWRVEPSSLDHPLFEVVAPGKAEGLSAVRFPKVFPLSLPDRNAAGRPVGLLARGAARAPMFVEAPRGSGRVLVAAIPLDAGRGGNLIGVPAFVPLVHEIAYRLAAVSADTELSPGRPLTFRLPGDRSPGEYRLTPPGGVSLPFVSDSSAGHPCRVTTRDGVRTLVFTETVSPGVYRIDGPDGVRYRVVAADPREGDLTPATPEELARLRDGVGLLPLTDMREAFRDEATREQRQDLAWLLLFVVLCLLCGELWLIRRHALRK